MQRWRSNCRCVIVEFRTISITVPTTFITSISTYRHWGLSIHDDFHIPANFLALMCLTIKIADLNLLFNKKRLVSVFQHLYFLTLYWHGIGMGWNKFLLTKCKNIGSILHKLLLWNYDSLRYLVNNSVAIKIHKGSRGKHAVPIKNEMVCKFILQSWTCYYCTAPKYLGFGWDGMNSWYFYDSVNYSSK